jgi:Protein of unknown function (DUF3108)
MTAVGANPVMALAQTAEAAPRTRVLLGLGAGVLLVHLFFLGGGFSGWTLDDFLAPATEASGAVPASAADALAAATEADAPETPAPVRSSLVRWIVPRPPPPVAATPVPPAPRPLVAPDPPAPSSEPDTVATAPDTPPEPPPETVARSAPPDETPATPAETTDTPTAPVSDLAPGTVAAAGTVVGTGASGADAVLPPAVPPPSAELSYAVRGQVKGLSYSANGLVKWVQDGRTYDASMTVRALFLGSRGQTSVGRLNDKGLAPERFADRSRSERAAHFDRDAQKVRYSNNAPDATLLPGMQDRLSVNFQLAGLFNARPGGYPEGSALRIPVSTIDLAEVWLFQVGAKTRLSLPAGDVAALKVMRSPRREFDRTVELWLSPDLAHLPVRMRITEHNGDYLDMQLSALPTLNPSGAPATP